MEKNCEKRRKMVKKREKYSKKKRSKKGDMKYLFSTNPVPTNLLTELSR